MKLYTMNRAPNPRRIMFFAAEKRLIDAETGAPTPGSGLDVEQVDIFSGVHKTNEFRALSPRAQLPVLVLDDGRALTESRAISSYLEHLHPEPNLMGSDPVEAAFIEMWDRRMELLLFLPGAMAVRHGHPAFASVQTQITDYAAASRKGFESSCRWLDQELANRPYIAGEACSRSPTSPPFRGWISQSSPNCAPRRTTIQTSLCGANG